MGAERFRAPEILFNPEIIGLEYPGVHQIVVEAIHRTDMDLRKSLYGNIVLSGGSTLTKGFGNRLLHEVQRLAVKDMRIKILAPPERIYTTWTGGSILAGLSTFKKVSTFVIDSVFHVLISHRCGSRKTNGRKIQTLSIRNSPSGIVVASKVVFGWLCGSPEAALPPPQTSRVVREGYMTLGSQF